MISSGIRMARKWPRATTTIIRPITAPTIANVSVLTTVGVAQPVVGERAANIAALTTAGAAEFGGSTRSALIEALNTAGAHTTPLSSKQWKPPTTLPHLISYISYTDQERGIDSVEAARRYIREVAPSWWAPDIDADGTVVLQEVGVTEEDTAFVSSWQAAGGIVRPALANYYGSGTGWTWTPVSTIINNSGLRATHVAAIVSLVVTKGYEGIDLDYEHGLGADRAAFTTFVTDLATALHANGKTLTVVVHPKFSEPGPSGKTQAQDWRSIAAVADQVRVMLYDYDPDVGADEQSPYSWWVDMVRYSLAQIPASKLVFGAPTYGYDWNTSTNSWVQRMWDEMVALAVTHSQTPTYSADKEWTFSYSSAPVRTVYYQDATSLAERAALLRAHGVAGMHFWRAGGEDPALWKAVAEAMETLGPFTASVEAVKDAYIDAADTDKHVGVGDLAVKANAERRALMHFDLSFLPDGATVSSAELTITRNGFAGTEPGGRTYQCYRLTQTGWTETANGNPASDGVTWARYDEPSSAWTTAGGDFTTTDGVTATVPGSDGPMTFTGMKNLVDTAVSSVSKQLHLIIKDSATATNHQTFFASREDTTPDSRPRMTVVYTLAPATTASVVMGAAGHTLTASQKSMSLGTLSTGAATTRASLTAALVENLLGNTGFEWDSNADGVADGWTKYATSTCTLDSGRKVSGTYSQKMIVAAAATADLHFANIPVEAGTGYSWSVQAWVDALEAGGVFVLKVEWLDAGLSVVDYNYTTASATDAGWTRRTVSAVAPVGAVYAKLILAIENGGTVYYDEAQFEATITPATYREPEIDWMARAIFTASDPAGSEGAIGWYVDKAAIRPYEASFAAIAFAAAYRRFGVQYFADAAWDWVTWYRDNMEADGTMYDWDIVGGVLTKLGTRDSTDSYAGMYLRALKACYEVDPRSLSGFATSIGKALDAIQLTQDTDGLTFALPGGGSVKYMMDQAETASGAAAARELFVILADLTSAAEARNVCNRMLVGIESLWNPSTPVAPAYDWAKHSGGARDDCDWTVLGDALQEAWAVIFRVIPVTTRVTQLMSQFDTSQPAWSTPTIAGNYYGLVGVGYQRVGDDTSAQAGVDEILQAAQVASRAWDYNPKKAGWAMLVRWSASDLLGQPLLGSESGRKALVVTFVARGSTL